MEMYRLKTILASTHWENKYIRSFMVQEGMEFTNLSSIPQYFSELRLEFKYLESKLSVPPLMLNFPFYTGRGRHSLSFQPSKELRFCLVALFSLYISLHAALSLGMISRILCRVDPHHSSLKYSTLPSKERRRLHSPLTLFLPEEGHWVLLELVIWFYSPCNFNSWKCLRKGTDQLFPSCVSWIPVFSHLLLLQILYTEAI